MESIGISVLTGEGVGYKTRWYYLTLRTASTDFSTSQGNSLPISQRPRRRPVPRAPLQLPLDPHQRKRFGIEILYGRPSSTHDNRHANRHRENQHQVGHYFAVHAMEDKQQKGEETGKQPCECGVLV
jgi:hypothetical protein